MSGKIRLFGVLALSLIGAFAWAKDITGEVDGGELVEKAKAFSEQVSFKAKRVSQDNGNGRYYYIYYSRVNPDGSNWKRDEFFIDDELSSYTIDGPEGRFYVENGISIKRDYLKESDRLVAEAMAEFEAKQSKDNISKSNISKTNRPEVKEMEFKIIDDDSFSLDGRVKTRAELGDELFERMIQMNKDTLRLKEINKKNEEEKKLRKQWYGSVELISEDGKEYYLIKEQANPYVKTYMLHDYKIGKDDSFIYAERSYQPSSTFDMTTTYINVEFNPDLPDELFVPETTKILVAKSEKEYKAIREKDITATINNANSAEDSTGFSGYIKIIKMAMIAVGALLLLVVVAKIVVKK